MENKDRYYKALIENDGRLNEIDLGVYIGLNEDETTEIIAQLLSEYKIDYKENRNCKYTPVKAKIRK